MKLEKYKLTPEQEAQSFRVETKEHFGKYITTLYDKNNNSWNLENFSTIEEAIEISKTLVNCKNCVDCINCDECVDCENCEYCLNCWHCSDCSNLKNGARKPSLSLFFDIEEHTSKNSENAKKTL